MRIIKKLTKDEVLSKVSQEEIFSRFLNIPLDVISVCATKKSLTHSAFRSKDSTPSMGFLYKSNGKLVCRDFGGFFHGDCFDAVAYQTPGIYNASSGADFMKVLEVIDREFRISGNTHNIISSIIPPDKVIKRFRFSHREWDNNDIKFWRANGISIDTLKHYNVYPVDSFYIEDYLYGKSSKNFPIYAFYLGKDNKHTYWQVYLPGRKPKYLSNKPIVMGIRQIKVVKIGGIVKSLKEVMIIHEVAVDRALSLQGISPPSESATITDEQFNYLNNFWDKVLFTLSDYDKAGIGFAVRHRNKYDTIPYTITNGKFNTINFGAKDLTDLVSYYSYEFVADLIEMFYSEYKTITKEKVQNYVNSQIDAEGYQDDTPF